MRILSVGSLPPAWGGPAYGGVATLHATLLEGFFDPQCAVEVIGVVPPAPIERELPVPVFARQPDELVAPFYEGLLERLEPDAVLMHHFAHTIGVTHARLSGAPPAIGVAHSWHNITFRSGDERERAREVTVEALGGLRALVGMSRHCLWEGEDLGLPYPALVETIYHPLQPRYSQAGADAALGADRRGIAYLGSLIPRKDPASLVEAATRLPGLEVTLAGHGELEPSLEALIGSRSLADRVSIAHLDDGQVQELLLRSEAMCLPSRSETFGLAYTEALACGTPVVGFGPTLREIQAEVGTEIGVALESSEVGEVAAAIERVRGVGWDRAKLRRRTVAAFGLPGAAERYAELIGQAIGGDPEPRPPAAPAGSGATGPASEPTAICVLGMSRTGTSLTARILNCLGVHLGPDEELLGGELSHLAGEGEEVLARAKEANPEGFWEHYRLMRLNEGILRTLGGNWRDPPEMAPGWEGSESLDSAREEARALLAESFAGQELWGWKDPRNSLTLPFWQGLVPRMRYVICLRNPVDVAASLERRDGMPLAQGVELWTTYLAAALVNTAGRRRLLVPYERYFEDPRQNVAGLARFVEREAALDGPAIASVERAIDARLWRNRTRPEQVVKADCVSPQAASLYLVVELLAAAQDAVDPDADLAGLNEAVDRYARSLLAQLAPTKVP